MNKELDCLIIGFAAGALASLWVGYWLRGRVERWHSGRATRRQARAREHDFPTTVAGNRETRRGARHIPFGDLSDSPTGRRPPAPPPFQPIPPTKRRDLEHPTLRAAPRIPIAVLRERSAASPADALLADLDADRARAAETARIIREDAVAALTGAGYKRAAAEAALDACTFVERAGGLESWVASALRRAAAKP